MANGNNNNGPNDPITRFYVVLIIVAGGILTGNGFLVRQATVQIDAPDRYTGTQGRALERRVTTIEQVDVKLVENIAGHLTNHPDHELRLLLREALLRISQLEREIERLEKNSK